MAAANLAAGQYSVRADYTFMLPIGASDDESPENVYIVRHTGRQWKMTVLPPTAASGAIVLID